MLMFHLAPSALLPRDSVVGIFDLDTATVSRHTRDFLRRAQEGGCVVAAGEDLPQSFIVTSDCRGGCPHPSAIIKPAPPATPDKIYLSPQSSANLTKKLLTIP